MNQTCIKIMMNYKAEIQDLGKGVPFADVREIVDTCS
jgi:hypothetical protein